MLVAKRVSREFGAEAEGKSVEVPCQNAIVIVPNPAESHVRRTTLYAAVLIVFWMTANAAMAEVYPLPAQGKLLIEAESTSATSKEYPRREASPNCSGRETLGFFWKDSWFEIEVQVPTNCTYRVTMRTSSIEGTSLELYQVNGVADESSGMRLDLIEVPKTGEWSRYTTTEAIELPLTTGKHTLRFKNSGEGANVDFLTFAAESDERITSYRLPKTTGPNRNPLKGFCSGWWRPDDDYATVGFQYIEWGSFEPQDDRFDWEYVENVLHREGSRQRHLILQFVVDWDHREPVEANYLGPDWLLKKVGEHRGHASPSDSTSRAMRATKYNDPVYIKEATEAIEALTNYFQNDPRIFVLQAGLLGFWSEWHTFPREDWSPSDETKRKILSVYLDKLPQDSFTQIRYPDEASVEPRRGIGYTNGSATPTEHGYEFGKQIEQRALWKNGPITGEWPPNVERKYWERFFVTDEGQSFIEQARYSTLLMPEPKTIKQQLEGWEPTGRFQSMHRSLGYNFQVDRVSHVMTEDGRLDIKLTLSNIGIAPFYQNWDVQLALLDAANSAVKETLKIAADIRELGPGEQTTLSATNSIALDPKRSYQIGLRIIQPGADQPKTKRWRLDARNTYVALANDILIVNGVWDAKHRLQGGWNIVGDITRQNSFPYAGSIRPLESADR